MQTKSSAFVVACIGGETLDLSPFTELMQYLPADLGIAIVIIDHGEGLATRLLDVLPSHTRKRVEAITEGLPLQPGKVFVAQRGHDVHVLDGVFRLTPVSKPTGWSNVITIFLRSLVHHWQARSSPSFFPALMATAPRRWAS